MDGGGSKSFGPAISGADTGFRKGENTKTRAICARARNVFPLFMKFGGPPKGGVLTPRTPPPSSLYFPIL